MAIEEFMQFSKEMALSFACEGMFGRLKNEMF